MNRLYKNPDGDVLDWRTDNPFAPGAITHQGMVYAIQHPMTGKMIFPANKRCWTFAQSDMLEIMRGWGDYELRDLDDAKERAAVCGCAPEEVRQGVCGIVLSKPLEVAKVHAKAVYDAGVRKEKPWPRFYFTSGGKGGIARKTYLDSVGGKPPTNLWPHAEVGHTDEAKKELMALFDGQAPFDTPKPSRLIQRVIQVASNPGDIVLDSFAGSGTTAHAVLKENAAHPDAQQRRFILVEMMREIAEEVTAKRIRKVIDGYAYKGKEYAACGGSFRFYGIGKPLFDEYGNVFGEVSFAQLARHVWFSETGTPLPDDAPLETPMLGVHDGRAIYLLYNGILKDKAPRSGNALTRETLALLPPFDGEKVVYGTAKLLSDARLRDLCITFRQLPYDLRR